MKRIWKWYNNLSNRLKDSIAVSIGLIGLISTLMSIIGVSLNDWTQSKKCSVLIVILACGLFTVLSYLVLGAVFKSSVKLTIHHTPVSISCGNIFEVDGWRVIGCDTHFDTRVDDVVISKRSLHGQLVLKHGDKDEIKTVIENEANRLGLVSNEVGLYDFPLGTVIRYDSSVDGKTYLMLAMTELDSEYKAHTNMAKFEQMLMKMWNEIDRVYASNTVVLPLLGTGISRFDDGPKDKEALLKCMLCTLNNSGVTLNSEIKVVIFGKAEDIPLYEYRSMFKAI